MTNPFAEAGSVLAAIKRSEKQRDTTIGHAQDRHHDRVQKILAEASPEARALVLQYQQGVPYALAEAKPVASEAAASSEAMERLMITPPELLSASDDLSTIAPPCANRCRH